MFAVGTDELETREVLSADFVKSIEGTSTYDLMLPDLAEADSEDALARYTHLDSKRYLPDDILTKVDRMSMFHSLEVRSPFLDYRIFELASKLPHHLKINRGDTKVILKKAFAQDLPLEVLTPRKRGFSVPIAKWLRGELRPTLQDALHDPEVSESGVFHMPELHKLAHEHLSGRRDRAHLLWRYLFFARWWHQHARGGRYPVSCA